MDLVRETQTAFEAVIDAFLMEMSGICAVKSDAELRRLPGFVDELQESATLMRDALETPTRLLPLSFGVVDEFVQANREEVIRECYALSGDMNGGRSHRHPEHSG
jgi:hypothetical protein